MFVVLVVIFAVLLENSGLMKAGPRQAEFEPQQGKTYKFSDVHGVDEAKEVRNPSRYLFFQAHEVYSGTSRSC